MLICSPIVEHTRLLVPILKLLVLFKAELKRPLVMYTVKFSLQIKKRTLLEIRESLPSSLLAQSILKYRILNSRKLANVCSTNEFLTVLFFKI